MEEHETHGFVRYLVWIMFVAACGRCSLSLAAWFTARRHLLTSALNWRLYAVWWQLDGTVFTFGDRFLLFQGVSTENQITTIYLARMWSLVVACSTAVSNGSLLPSVSQHHRTQRGARLFFSVHWLSFMLVSASTTYAEWRIWFFINVCHSVLVKSK